MKKINLKNIVPLVVICALIVVGGSISINRVFAATGSIYLTPTSSSIQPGSNVTVSLRINPGTPVNGVEANINFDTAKLEFVSASPANGAFSAELLQVTTGGTIQVARGVFGGGVSTDSLVVTVVFKALASSGSSAITLTNANATALDASYTNPAAQNATVTFTTPVPTPSPTPTPAPAISPPPSSAPATPKAPLTTPAPAKPTVPTVATPTVTTAPEAGAPQVVEAKTESQYTIASVNFNTDVPSTSYVQYGLDNTLPLTTPVTALASSHSISFDTNLLAPGNTYYYKIVTSNAAGKKQESAIKSFKTLGLTLKVSVLDANQKPIRNKIVTLYSTPVAAKTDKYGYAVITGVTPGTHHLKYGTGKTQLSQEIQAVNNITTVGSKQTAPVQNFSVVYPVKQSNDVPSGTYAIITILLAAVGGVYLYKNRKRFAHVTIAQSNPAAYAPVNPNTVPDSTEQNLSTVPFPNVPEPGQVVNPAGDRKIL